MTYDQWLSAYLSVLGISLTLLGVVIAIVALWGYREIKAGALKKAEAVADQRIREFLESGQLEDRLKKELERATDRLYDDMRITGAFPVSETGNVGDESKPLGDKYPGDPDDVR